MFTGSHGWTRFRTSFKNRRRIFAYSGQANNQRMCSLLYVGCRPRLLLVTAIFCACGALTASPLQFMHHGLYGAFWFLLKVSAYIYVFIWLRVTSPLSASISSCGMGWHILIPLGLINIVDVGIAWRAPPPNLG